jgi:hypothetical protein
MAVLTTADSVPTGVFRPEEEISASRNYHYQTKANKTTDETGAVKRTRRSSKDQGTDDVANTITDKSRRTCGCFFCIRRLNLDEDSEQKTEQER